MTNNEIVTLFISGCSALVAMFALGWNVYRDVVNKPKIKVRVNRNHYNMLSDLEVNITNEGHGSIDIRCLAVRKGGVIARMFGRTQKNSIYERTDNDGYDRLPHELGEYEDCTLLVDILKYDKLLSGNHIYVGAVDALKRTHWVKYK